MMRRWSLIAAAVVLGSICVVSDARAQSGDNILVITNALSQASDEIGNYYAAKRTVPSAQILRLPIPISEQIERRDYEAKIEGPIGRWLTTHAAQDRILYIVLTKDVPLRVAGNDGPNGTVASVDSELTLLYRKLAGSPIASAGQVKNPYFYGEAKFVRAPRFNHQQYDIYLVTRLDGYTVADVKAVIDRGLAPARQGKIVLDGKLEVRQTVGNKWLIAAATAIKGFGGWADNVVLDTTQTTIANQQNVIGFYSWGSNVPSGAVRHYGHNFAAGAIGGEFVSTDARTFKEPPPEWVVNDTKNPYGGSHQSLIGDLIRDGITGVAGHVAEPYLNATIRPDLLFPAYLSGFNLAESFYLAMPSLSWQTVIIGDPLCALYPIAGPATTDLNPMIDPATEMPALFAARRLLMMGPEAAKSESAKLLLKAEVMTARNDLTGAKQVLEQATALDDGLAGAQMLLAVMANAEKNWDVAIDRYQRVIKASPNHYVALNNLAYILAVQKKDPQSALPLASRAYLISVKDAAVGDTLAWIDHLLGRDATAELIIAETLLARPKDPEVTLHAAIIYAANGKMTVAAKYLADVLAADPSMAGRDDVKELQKRLRTAK
jgi:uncharacterized protein (TIGR03790 family)